MVVRDLRDRPYRLNRPDLVDIALFLIGSLDDDGYLRRDLDTLSDDMAFRLGLEANKEELTQ
ncbi:MAG: hypothetical protein PHT74_08105, partial [Methanoculleus horonobensis]|nr:hypothetical protein [Methanoculleus horonobensis]